MSAPVQTTMTPGACSAAALSMPLILAWACGERTKSAWTCPGRSMSSVKRPWPVRKRKSSLRLTLAPIPVSGPESGMVLPLHARGGRLDGLDDVVITRAAADVALQPLADLVFLGIGVLLQKVHGEIGRAHV